jgi:hypothetical protein
VYWSLNRPEVAGFIDVFCFAGETADWQTASHMAAHAAPADRQVSPTILSVSIRVHPWLKTNFDVRLKLSFPTCPNADT